VAEEEELVGWERSRAAQKGHGRLYTGLAIVTALATGIWIGSRVFADPNSSAFGLNLWTEALGMLVTVGLFGLINEWQAERRYKKQLVDEVGSESNEIAKHAVSILRRRGLLEGESGLLQGKNLEKADLSGITLTRANLQGVNLTNGVLRDTQLQGASLAGANLSLAKMQDARMIEADLSKAKLFCADLESANLPLADLRGADLFEANLENANLIGVKCDSRTRLPNGLLYTSMTNLEIFTDPNHKTFWRSRVAGRPAYPIKARY